MFVLKTTFCTTIFVLLSIVMINGDLLFSVEKDVIFRLYTPEQPDVHEEIKPDNLSDISQTSFNPHRPTRIFIHGFRSKENMIFRYRDAYLKLGNFNFIAVDWTKGAETFNYFMVLNRVKPVSFDSILYVFVLGSQTISILARFLLNWLHCCQHSF